MRKTDENDQDTMTLRDRFAMAALMGLVTNAEAKRNQEATVRWAYLLADAMLAERATHNAPTRTAEEERADVVAFLRDVAADYDRRAINENTSPNANHQLAIRGAAVARCADRIADGNHAGAAERAKAGAK